MTSNKKTNVHVIREGQQKPISVRHINQTDKDRETYAQQFREQKNHEQKVKEERFAKIRERRKKLGPKGGSGGGINVEVTSDN